MKHSIKTNQPNPKKNPFHTSLCIMLFWISFFALTVSIFPQEAKITETEKEVTEKKKVDKDVVSDLTATLSADSISIELKWTPPSDEGDVIIARSNQVIDTMEKLGVSDSLGKYKSDKVNFFNHFNDTNLRPGEYYYAIVLVSQIKKKRVKLFPGVNYTITPAVVPVQIDTPKVVPQIAEVKHEADSISNLKIRTVENSVRLSWTPPIGAEDSIKYTIYRSPDPMSNVGLMEKATKIGEVIHPETTFLDTGLDSSQTVYYGVTVTIQDKEATPLIEDKSFRKFYFVKTEKKEEPAKDEKITVVEEKKDPVVVVTKPLQVTNLTGDVRKDGILLAWTAPEGAVANSSKYSIYESNARIADETNGTLIEKAKKIGTVVHPDVSFLHPNLNKKTPMFYAVTTKTGEGEENLILQEGKSFIKIDPSKKKKKKKKKKIEETKAEETKPEVIKPEEKPSHSKPVVEEETNPDFDTIMSQYYKKDKFTEARVKFESLADRVSSNSIRGTSLFFAALCYYNQKEYSSALRILLSEDVQMNYDKERVDFYVKRCLENRGSK